MRKIRIAHVTDQGVAVTIGQFHGVNFDYIKDHHELLLLIRSHLGVDTLAIPMSTIIKWEEVCPDPG